MTENRRTSILIEDGEEGSLRVKLTGSPRVPKGKGKPMPPLVLEPPTDERKARDHGASLVAALKDETRTKDAIADALRAPIGEVWPLCFEIESELESVSGLVWEALWVEDLDFLALNPQWPIARVVDSDSTARIYHAPLRILAVMSALGITAQEEWEGLRSAVEAVSDRGLPVQVTVIVGERDLLRDLRELEADPVANVNHWLTVVALESRQTIMSHLKQRPHIVHFFCHGSAEFGGGHISFATIQDRAAGAAATESVTVDLNRLKVMVDNRRLWLVTLNCCSGSQFNGPTHALAQNVVEAGAGAALGWRTPVEPEDAHLLCSTVYSWLLSEIAEQLVGAADDDIVTLELAKMGYDLRGALHDQHEDHRDLLCWALPVLFVAGEPLSVTVVSRNPDDPGDLRKMGVSSVDRTRIARAVATSTSEDFTEANPGLAELKEILALVTQRLADVVDDAPFPVEDDG